MMKKDKKVTDKEVAPPAEETVGEDRAETSEVEALRQTNAELAATLRALTEQLAVMGVRPLGPHEDVEWVWARRSFGYAGSTLDRGQIIKLHGERNDEKLVRLGYFQKLEKGAEQHECAVCGARFIGIEYRTAHGDLRHQHRCVCGGVFTSPEALRQHQRVCAPWQTSHRHLTPVQGLEGAAAGVGRPG